MPVLGNIADRLIYGLTIPTTIRALVFNSTPTTTSPGPINNYYRRYVYKVIYTVAELQSAGWTKGMTIRRISFYVTNQPTYQPYPSYTIGMINTASAVGSDITAGWTTVRNAANISFTASQENIITLDTAFAWNGTSNLGIGFAWGQSPTNWSSSGVVESNTTGSARFAVTDGTGTYLLTDVAGSTGTGRPAIRLYA